MDLKSEGQAEVSMETLTWIHTHKTAALLKAAVAGGAVLAGASDEASLPPGPARALVLAANALPPRSSS